MAAGGGLVNIGLVAGMAGALAACAATKQRPSGSADAAAGTGAGAGASGAARDGGSGGAAGTSSDNTDGPGRVIGADALGDAACATATQRAEQLPLDIYVMMDSSGSMLDFVSTTGTATKWTAVRAALISFLQDPQSAGIGVGLQYFPLVQPGVPETCETTGECAGFGPCDILRTCSMTPTVTACVSNADCRGGGGTCVRLGVCNASGGYCAPPGGACSTAANDECLAIAGYCLARDKCDVPSYTAPAVEVAPLPGAAAALVSSLNQHTPDGLTPTSGALAGAVAHAQALARANPTHKVVVLLATDGLPSECAPTDIAGVAAIAATAQAGSPAISTYVIGVFAPEEMAAAQANLDALAAAGGTGRAFIVSTNSQNVTQSFVAALNAVRTSSLACQYAVPGVAGGGQVDYFSVNVQFTSGAGQTVTVGNVKNRAGCSATQGGWYYDADPAAGGAPQTISICDTSCTQMRADPQGRVDVLLGCKTIIIVE